MLLVHSWSIREQRRPPRTVAQTGIQPGCRESWWIKKRGQEPSHSPDDDGDHENPFAEIDVHN